MDKDGQTLIVGLGVLFAVVFGGMTFVALSTATLNFASIMAFGISFVIIVLLLIALIGAIRNPPDE